MILRRAGTISAGKDLGSWLDNVVYTLGEPLESDSNRASGHLPTFSTNLKIRPLALQEHWILSCLWRLELGNEKTDIVINTKHLTSSLLLEDLTVNGIAYDLGIIKLQEPFQLPKLKEPRLGDQTTLAFHPSSLQNSPLLETPHLDCTGL